MKIVIAGRGWLAVRGCRLFSMVATVELGGADIVCVPATEDVPDAPPSWRPSLRAAARRHGWVVAESFRDVDLEPSDLVLLLQYDRIVRMADLRGARALNLHFAPLPRHRGSLSCVWPILDRDADVGVTLHEVTAEVDAGPIVASRNFPLSTSLTAGDLYRLFHREGFELLADNAGMVLRGSYSTTPQEGGTRARRRGDIDFDMREITDFTTFAQSARAVRDNCLARIFPEFQTASFRDRPVERVYVLDVQAAEGPVGEVVAETATSALVRCADGLVAFEYSA